MLPDSKVNSKPVSHGCRWVEVKRKDLPDDELHVVSCCLLVPSAPPLVCHG